MYTYLAFIEDLKTLRPTRTSKHNPTMLATNVYSTMIARVLEYVVSYKNFEANEKKMHVKLVAVIKAISN